MPEESDARHLRNNPTPEEAFLWQKLRRRRFSGYKFRRQRAIGPFIVDFVCLEANLIVELDGGQHNEGEAKDYDMERTEYLEKAGYKVIRFWNPEVKKNLEGVMRAIYTALTRDKELMLPQSGPSGHLSPPGKGVC